MLFIDADPQGNSTAWMIGDTTIAHDLADVLFKKCTAKSAVATTPKQDGVPSFPDALSLIPTASLGSTLRLYSDTIANQSPYAIRQLLKTVRDDFDYAIIDTSPAFGPLEQSCLLASDEAVAVLNIDEFSYDGLITFIDSLVDMRERYDTEKPILARLVLNSRNKSQKMQDNYTVGMVGNHE